MRIPQIANNANKLICIIRIRSIRINLRIRIILLMFFRARTHRKIRQYQHSKY